MDNTRQFADDQFRLMLEAVVDYAIYMLDPDGRIVSWNLGAQRLKGYAQSEVIGRHYSLFFTPEAIREGKPKQELERAKADGRFEEEGWRIRKDGAISGPLLLPMGAASAATNIPMPNKEVAIASGGSWRMQSSTSAAYAPAGVAMYPTSRR
jgi:PAS domain S-box-containing protein